MIIYILLAAAMLLLASGVFADDESKLIMRYKPDGAKLRILFLGNSFTYFNDMYIKAGNMLSAETVQNVRGGAYLRQQLDKNDELGSNAAKLLTEERWDYVVLQEQSCNPMTHKEDFLKSSRALCKMIRENGAKPVFYGTWAYKKGSEKLQSVHSGYWEMFCAMSRAYYDAASENKALLANVGAVWYKTKGVELYNQDGYHPTEEGTRIAAEVIAETIRKDMEKD